MRITVIIPTRNEAVCIGQLVEYLRGLPRHNAQLEIIVSDGGSDDETCAIAKRAGARVLTLARGRGPQQSAAVEYSTGEVLWFLHADAWPHRKSLLHIEKSFQRGAVGGHFRLRFDSPTLAARVFETIARLQSRHGIFYGDSGMWATRSAWNELRGFKAWPLFEDYDFARRLRVLAKKQHRRIDCPWLPITVSARRFEKSPWRVLTQWAWLQFLFQIGVSPRMLAKWYFRR